MIEREQAKSGMQDLEKVMNYTKARLSKNRNHQASRKVTECKKLKEIDFYKKDNFLVSYV